MMCFYSRDVYSSDEAPFLYITQFRLATHLIVSVNKFLMKRSFLLFYIQIMSMETFNILAQSLPHPDCNIVILANTGRSGSTLLAQMFESVPGMKKTL